MSFVLHSLISVSYEDCLARFYCFVLEIDGGGVEYFDIELDSGFYILLRLSSTFNSNLSLS